MEQQGLGYYREVPDGGYSSSGNFGNKWWLWEEFPER
jgi:hypothetical protein